jgi:hypothetical protein
VKLDIVDSAYRQVVKQEVASALPPAPEHNLLVDILYPVEEVALAHSVVAVHREESVVIADIDRASFAKALTDFENCRVQACPGCPEGTVVG